MRVLRDRDGDLWLHWRDGKFRLLGDDEGTEYEADIVRIWGPVVEGTIIFEETK